MRLGSVRFGSGETKPKYRFDSFRFGPDRFGSDRFGLDRFWSVRFGSDRFWSFRFGSERSWSVRFGSDRRSESGTWSWLGSWFWVLVLGLGLGSRTVLVVGRRSSGYDLRIRPLSLPCASVLCFCHFFCFAVASSLCLCSRALPFAFPLCL
jgi:hypothetical protein